VRCQSVTQRVFSPERLAHYTAQEHVERRGHKLRAGWDGPS